MVYGLSCYHGNEKGDVFDQFIDKEIITVGWEKGDAVGFHSMIRELPIGAIVFLKSFNMDVGLHVKAVGVIKNTYYVKDDDLGFGRYVKWFWSYKDYDNWLVKFGLLNDKMDIVRTQTIYDEKNPFVCNKIIELMYDPEDYINEIKSKVKRKYDNNSIVSNEE
jgi:hypothetical protein